MRDFLRRVLNTEFLPMSEVRRIKVSLVMIFLLVMTAVTIPFSIFLDYKAQTKIIVIALLLVFFLVMVFSIRWNKSMLAMHLTIIYSVALTMFYTLGSATLYAYLFFYITLVIIIFYQEIFAYLVYGGLVLLFGIFYTIIHQDGLVLTNDIPGSAYIYIAFLIIFYFVFFIQIFLNEKFYTDLNYEWVQMNHVVDKYQDHILFYMDIIRKEMKDSAFYEDLDFQKAADELSAFIYEQFNQSGKDIINVLDLYLYIHERGIEKILENEEFSISTKKIANRLSKYLLDQRTEMFSMIINFHTKFRQTSPYKENRYLYDIESITAETDEQIIAIALIYLYLSNEIIGLNEWEEMNKVLTSEELDNLFLSPEMESFMSSNHLGFFKDNYELFKEHLSKKKK
ncbi:MAG: hypothetical protein KKE16_06125 [Firmicutes bacterium]|nr:hypothetical protein [Bacillota bacterium]